MKQTNKPLLCLTLLSVGFVFGLYTGDWCGRKVGRSEGRFDGYNEAISELQAPTDSLRAAYIQSRDYYDNKLDSLIEIYDKK
ncbi:MAG: hypothetical protein K2K82_00955 [Muribaculaceae bacterium]|nr:hypothetical protein [Muribaculaceae bacterium]